MPKEKKIDDPEITGIVTKVDLGVTLENWPQLTFVVLTKSPPSTKDILVCVKDMNGTKHNEPAVVSAATAVATQAFFAGDTVIVNYNPTKAGNFMSRIILLKNTLIPKKAKNAKKAKVPKK